MSIKLRAALASLCLGLLAVSLTFGRLDAPQTGKQMATAAEAFLESLSNEQRDQATMPLDDPKRLDWHFIPKAERKGLQIREMNQDQRKRAHALLEASLSEGGYKKTTTIMELENLLKELEKGKTGTPLRDAERYYFTLFGTPSDDRWGLSIEGHHLSLNFVVEKGKVESCSPLALCANPAVVMTDVIPSIPKGLRLLAQEEQSAFELLGALSPDQKKAAVIDEKPLTEVRAAGEPHPPKTELAGIAGKDLSEKQRSMLKRLVAVYLANVPEEVAQERMQSIESNVWEDVYFAWAGAEKPGSGHYYRVQGPTFLIEFVNTQPDAAGNPANHIHSVWRDPRGDFGVARGE
jgi:hypothetical protein